jgi:nucleotide-binding universal stress UspA family protein
MKTILVPIDFSKSSEIAAHYALHLAKYIRANISLCHAFYIPVEVPTTAFGSWPGYDFNTLKEESIKSLEEVAFKLRNKVRDFSMPESFQPEVTCVAEPGGATDVIVQLAGKEKAVLTVMGMTGAGLAARLLFGSISRSMIDSTHLPLILVPEGFIFRKIKKIAFATSLHDDDVEIIRALASLAQCFDAELLVVNVSEKNDDDEAHQKNYDRFMNEVTSKIHYNQIYFRRIDKANIDKGLHALTEHGLIDLLVMVHLQKGLFDSLFSSHTHAKANNLNIPLLVIPAGFHPVF